MSKLVLQRDSQQLRSYREITEAMKKLLLQSCSQRKVDTQSAVPAIELYDGYFFRIIKRAKREGELSPNIDLMIISAEHGLIKPDTEIRVYDRAMDAERAEEIRPTLVREVKTHVQNGDYDEVIVCGGEKYRNAVKGLSDEINQAVTYVSGSGIGEMGAELKEIVSE